MKEKLINWTSSKVKSLLCENTVKRIKDKPHTKKTFANHIYCKEHVSRIKNC